MLQIVIRCSIESAADRRAGVLDDVAHAAVDADLPDRAEDQILRCERRWQLAHELEQHRLRTALVQRLRGEDVLDLGRADPERERAEGSVRRRVAVAADDRLPRLRQPELGPDHVDDALVPRAGAVEADAELLGVRSQRVELGLRHRVGRPAPAGSGRCGPSSRRSARDAGRGGRRAAGPRTPAAMSPRGRDAGRRRAARARPAPRGRCGGPRPSRTASAPCPPRVRARGRLRPRPPPAHRGRRPRRRRCARARR